MTLLAEPAPAKLNLALHVRGKRDDGRHDLDTVYAFCVDGDLLRAEEADRFALDVDGPFADGLPDDEDNLIIRAAKSLARHAGLERGATLLLTKELPIASGIGGGSADAAATLRLLTRLWNIDPKHALSVAPDIGSDVPACLLSMTARGSGAGDKLAPFEDDSISGTPVLLVNPMVALSTADVFAGWDGEDRGPLDDWRKGRNDLEAPARKLVPEIGDVLDWLGRQDEVNFVRMSGSGATCFALFESEAGLVRAATACPDKWWHLASFLR